MEAIVEGDEQVLATRIDVLDPTARLRALAGERLRLRVDNHLVALPG